MYIAEIKLILSPTPIVNVETHLGVIKNHAGLENLDYASSGHTGFASTLELDKRFKELNIKSGTPKGSLYQEIDEDFTFDNPISKRYGEVIKSGVFGEFAISLNGKTRAEGKRSTSEGNETIAKGDFSHSEGDTTEANGVASHSQGWKNSTFANYSHVEGVCNLVDVQALQSHTEGWKNRVTGQTSHCEGAKNYIGVNSKDSHVTGSFNISNFGDQFVCGIANKNEDGNLLEVGNGEILVNPEDVEYNETDPKKIKRQNAFSVNIDGTAKLAKMGTNDNNVVIKKYVDDAIKGILQLYYPIGSLYFNVNLIDPSAVLGGTWVRIQDRFILAAGSTYPAGSTGGSATVTLTTSQIPSHSHSCSTNGEHDHDLRMSNESGSGLNWPQKRTCNGYSTYVNQISSNGSHSHTIGNAGGGSSHNNMPPYLTVYVWKRTS